MWQRLDASTSCTTLRRIAGWCGWEFQLLRCGQKLKQISELVGVGTLLCLFVATILVTMLKAEKLIITYKLYNLRNVEWLKFPSSRHACEGAVQKSLHSTPPMFITTVFLLHSYCK